VYAQTEVEFELVSIYREQCTNVIYARFNERLTINPKILHFWLMSRILYKRFKRDITTERYDCRSYLYSSGSFRCFLNLVLAIRWHFESPKVHAHLASSSRKHLIKAWSLKVSLYLNSLSTCLKISRIWTCKNILFTRVCYSSWE